ncbi:MAG: alkaline phosphatase family protein, partial [Planctomycetota bacterium]
MKLTLPCIIYPSAIAVMILALPLPSCERKSEPHPKVIVLGFDGMDPRLCERLMDQGRLPNLDKMRQAGGYRRLGTTIPPQSPVAWASFITGAGPGGHGIFDFIHRDPTKQCSPYYSAAETVEAEEGWEITVPARGREPQRKYRIPLTFWPFNHEAPHTVLRRGGTPFWDYLDEAGVPMRIYDLPSNYPPSRSRHGHLCCLAGMGVPDLLGGYGTYQFFSEGTLIPKTEGGGMRKPIVFVDDATTAVLVGPENGFLAKPVPTEVSFHIYRHPTEPTARIEIQGNTIVLKEGEWSDWQQVNFELPMPPFLPSSHVSGICRFYLQGVRPDFRLYVTPLNIDPSEPGSQRITEPPGFISQIADELGLFYTAGFQEDHKALSNKVFDDEEFRKQAA